MSATKKKGKFILIALAIIGIAGCVGVNAWAKQLITAVSRSTVADLGSIESYASLTGVVANGDETEYIVTAPTSVLEVNFKQGDTVSKGDVIARFDHTDARNEYRMAEIAYEQRKLSIEDNQRKYFDNKQDLEDAIEQMKLAKERRKDYDETSNDPEEKANFNRYDAVYKSEKAKKEQLEMIIPSDAMLKSEQLSLEQSRISLETASRNYNNLPSDIVADGDGVIMAINIRELVPVQKGTLAVMVKYNTTNTINFNIGKYDLPKIKIGQPVDVKIGRSTYTGVVSELGTSAVNGTVPSKITVDNPDELFVAGLEAEVDILAYKSESSLNIPVEAVKTDKNGDYCYVLTPTGKDSTYTATKTYITTGESSDTDIEVLSGINKGDRVLDNPGTNIDLVPVVKIKE